jgi:hypothetical protein
MKERHVKSLGQGVEPARARPVNRKHNRAQDLCYKGRDENVLYQRADLTRGRMVKALLNRYSVGYGEPLPEKHHEYGREGHKPEAAYLYAGEYDYLTEYGKGGPGIDYRQSGHAGRGGGGK